MADERLRAEADRRRPLASPAAGGRPRQGSEGAPDAWIVLEPSVADALQGIRVGDRLVLVTWLHEADRSVLQVHPRDDESRPLTGVFATRSSDRPNPLGLHEVTVLGIDGLELAVGPLEAIDGTPIVDIKPVLRRAAPRLVDGRFDRCLVPLPNTGAVECRLVAFGRVGHELPDLLSTAAGDGDLGSPLQRLLA